MEEDIYERIKVRVNAVFEAVELKAREEPLGKERSLSLFYLEFSAFLRYLISEIGLEKLQLLLSNAV